MTDPVAEPVETKVVGRKGRSPSYPGIDLELAVQRAEELWAREHHYQTQIATIMSHWGYGKKSGGGFGAIAALKSFGLLDDEGTGPDRLASLSDLGQAIVTEESRSERMDLIRAAALQPPIHRELWNRFGVRLPSDQTLQLFLMKERGFTPSGASEVISEWKRTMTFAELSTAGDNVTPADDQNIERMGEPRLTPPATLTETPSERRPGGGDERSERSTRTVQVTYSPTEWALVQAAFPMTEDDWDAMIEVLQAMKRGLVARD